MTAERTTRRVIEPRLSEAATLVAAGFQSGTTAEFCCRGTVSNGEVGDLQLLRRGNSQMVKCPLIEVKPGEVVLHSHPSGDLQASESDMELAEIAATMRVGFGIIAPFTADPSRVFWVVPPREVPPPEPMARWARLIGPWLVTIYKLNRPKRSTP